MPLLNEGEVVEYNLRDSLEVLTETEAVMLDMLVSKVQEYTEQKSKLVSNLAAKIVSDAYDKQEEGVQI